MKNVPAQNRGQQNSAKDARKNVSRRQISPSLHLPKAFTFHGLVCISAPCRLCLPTLFEKACAQATKPRNAAPDMACATPTEPPLDSACKDKTVRATRQHRRTARGRETRHESDKTREGHASQPRGRAPRARSSQRNRPLTNPTRHRRLNRPLAAGYPARFSPVCSTSRWVKMALHARRCVSTTPTQSSWRPACSRRSTNVWVLCRKSATLSSMDGMSKRS